MKEQDLTPLPTRSWRRRWVWLMAFAALVPIGLLSLRMIAIWKADRLIDRSRESALRRIQEFQDVSLGRPSYHSPSVEGDAWAAHVSVMTSVMSVLTSDDLEVFDPVLPDEAAPEEEDLPIRKSRMFKKLEPLLHDLRKGLFLTHVKPVFDWKRGLEQESFGAKNQLSFFRAVAFIAREQRLAGREPESLALLADGIAVAQDLSVNAALLADLMREVAQERLRDEIQELLRNHRLPACGLRELLRILQAVESQRTGIAEVMDRELVCMRISANRTMEEVSGMNWGVNPMSRYFFSNRILLANALQAFEEMEGDVRLLKKESKLDQVDHREAWTRHANSANPLVVIMTPQLAKAWNGWRVQQCRADLARCAAAIACHEAEKGRYPATLSELVPGFLPTLPLDLFARSSTFVYLTDRGSAAVYSLGEDGDDDGGRAFDEKEGGDPSDCDLVWTLKRRQ